MKSGVGTALRGSGEAVLVAGTAVAGAGFWGGFYSRVWAPPAAPAADPTGTFETTLDLSASFDPNDRPLWFFAVRVRGDPARTRVTQLDRTRFRVEIDWPADFAEDVGGASRTTRRAAIAFFAHNGVWLSAPAFASVFASDPFEPAPDANNLD